MLAVLTRRPRSSAVREGSRPPRAIIIALPLFLLAALTPAVAAADDPPAEPAKARLVADTKAFAPGSTFRLGVLFTIDPHWHIYWHSARDGGLGTEVTWKLPEGWRAGPLEWPVPARYVLPGPLVAYGYEKTVLLQAEITVPAGFSAAEPVTLGAELSWLVCKEFCVIGKGSPTLSLSAGTPAPSAEASLFADARARVPVAPAAAGIAVEESFEARDGGGTWRVALTFPEGAPLPDEKAMRAFPFDPPGGRLDEGRIESDGRRRVFIFAVEVQDAAFSAARLGAVFVWPAAEGGARPPTAVEVRHAARAAAQGS